MRSSGTGALLPHQTTQKTLTTARSHTYTHTLCIFVCVCISVYMCIHLYIEVSLSVHSHTTQLHLPPSHSHTHKKKCTVCLFLTLSVPGAVPNTPPLALPFLFRVPSRFGVKGYWCDRRRYRVTFLYLTHKNAWLWRLSEVEVGAGWQPGNPE
jgi:hypothetical protein